MENKFNVEIKDTEAALVCTPSGKKPRFGLIFYVGTFIPPNAYPFIANSLASQGYLVVIPKIKLNLTYLNYNEAESAFTDYPDVRFFVGDHSQGGGAAIRRAYEAKDRVLGVMLLSPLAYNTDTLKDTEVNVLLIEAENDKILNSEMKTDALSRLTDNTVSKTILGGNHMGYCDILLGALDGELTITKESMQSQTAIAVLSFMSDVYPREP